MYLQQTHPVSGPHLAQYGTNFATIRKNIVKAWGSEDVGDLVVQKVNRWTDSKAVSSVGKLVMEGGHQAHWAKWESYQLLRVTQATS